MRLIESSRLKPGETFKFRFVRQKKYVDGFLANFEGRLVAYENECRHIPISLDYGDNEFFSQDQKTFICKSHGALYDPLSGACLRGPCGGQSLKPLDIETVGGEVFVLGADPE